MVKIRLFVLLLVLFLASLASSSELSMGLKWEKELDDPVTAVEIADIDGDGKKEIVAAMSETRFIAGMLAGSGKIYVLDLDGNILNESSALIGPPSDILVVDDLDADGTSEIILGIYSHSHVLDSGCKLMFKPYVGKGRIIESVKTADLDGDGLKEIVITAVSDNQNQNGVYVFDNTGKRKWTKGTKGRSYSLAIADLNNDGRPEVVVGTTWGNGPISSSTGYISVLNSSGGEIFNNRMEGGGIVSVAVADLDNDGTGEILAGSWPALSVFDHEGNSKWNYTAGGRVNALVAEDLDNDGNKEIIIASNDIYVLDNEGELICKNPVGSEVYALEIKDLDGDGRAEILVGSDRFYILDNECNEVWNYRTDLSVKSISVDDLDNDGYYEVAVGSMDRKLYVFGSKEHVMGSSADDSYSEAQKLYLAGKHELALNYSRNAKELYQQLGDSKGVSRAQRLMEQIEGAIENQGNELETANRYYSLAENLSNSGDYLNASRYLKTAVAKYSLLSEVGLLSKADTLLAKTDSMVALMADSIYNNGSQKHSERSYAEAISILTDAREHYFWVK
ncbi:MAG: VCBS repeat-containing protein, partial [Candidatus Altiarchaeota archaeon]|nr:VCBS repeat-containing protein [Candidatus Altiarchaeota archaeon]